MKNKPKTLTVIKLDVKNEKPGEVIEILDELSYYQSHIGCSAIDIVERTIGEKKYCIVCDDVGALDEKRIVSSFNYVSQQPMFFGNLIITGLPDDEGNLTTLTNQDVKNIFSSIQKTIVFDERIRIYNVLMCDY